MRQAPALTYPRPPSALRYMLGALLSPRAGLARAGRFPALAATWRGARLGRRERERALALCGPGAEAGLSVLLPQLVGLRLQMAVLTHPAMPLPVWRALQVRNRLHLLQPVPRDEPLELTAGVEAQRLLEKGAELDLRTSVRAGGELLWEGIATYYYRGAHGLPAGPPSPVAQPPEVPAGPVDAGPAPSGLGWRAGHLTGDYNPLHWWRGYARRGGFRGPFLHPPLAVARCLSRLPAPGGGAQRLDAWFRGPVYQGAATALCADSGPAGTRFALLVEGDERPAVVGEWRAAGTGEALLAG